MKVICERSSFLAAINHVASIVPARTPTPALSCLKLTATKVGGVGEVMIAGSDAETSIAVTISQVDVLSPGVVVVPAQKLQQILSAIDNTDPTVTLELDGDQLRIKAAVSKFTVFTFPAADFPPLPDYAAVVSGSAPQPARAVFNVGAGIFRSLIDRTVFATARETSRYAINGVLLKRDGKKLEMVATDGRRLALCRVMTKGDGAGAGTTSCIIPTKALGTYSKLATDPEAQVTIAITDNRVFFGFHDAAVAPESKPAKAKATDKADKADKADKTETAPDKLPVPRAVLSSQLVEGSFPPYEDVIPKDQDKKVTVHTDELARAVRQASVLTNEESRGVRLAFTAKDKKLRITSRAPEMGESEVDCSLMEYTGEDLEISFNPMFIGEALKAISETDVVIELKASNRPGVLKAGSEFTYVVMPVNLPA